MATVKANGAEIYYEMHGDGPAITFAHGRGGNAASWWQQVPFSQKATRPSFSIIVFSVVRNAHWKNSTEASSTVT